MQVSEILAEKGTKIVTVGTGASILEVSQTLKDAGIGAVVVNAADGGVAGILSERDIVRAIASQGPAALEKTAADLMSRDVVTCNPESSTIEVLTQMQSGRLRHLPVMDDKGMVGIVSASDLVKAVNGELTWMTKALKEQLVAAAGRATDDAAHED
jgi:CBS domain-containing protein